MMFKIKTRGNRHGKKNGSRAKTKPGFNYRVYCGTCPITNMSHPEESTHGAAAGKNYVCPLGHITKVRF